MDLLNHLLIGFENAVTWTNLLYCFVGVTLGTLVGVIARHGPRGHRGDAPSHHVCA